jgi:DNA-binding response OmpR family regulator
MSKATILIVEDEKTLNEAYCFVLGKEGFKTYSAFNGKAALKIIEENPIDLVLLDLRMPKMSGLELLKQLPKDKKDKMHIIVFSNYDAQDEINQAFKHGAHKYMLKAWASPKELVKIVEDSLKIKSD